VSDDSDGKNDMIYRDLRLSFDYVDEIKQTDDLNHKLIKTETWVKNNTNVHVSNTNTYMATLRKA
jgi:hypothetical protein